MRRRRPRLREQGRRAPGAGNDQEREAEAVRASHARAARPAAYFSNEKICFQSFCMLMTVQPFFFASS